MIAEPVERCGEYQRKEMKINTNQKSVLTLFIITFGALLLSDAQNVLSIAAIIWWIILACWFYGVRTKIKPN
jgi:hypothetical protein